MPLYEYACGDCGGRREVRQRFTDEPLTMCEDCGGRVRRVLQPVGIVFKGSGWYITDSRKSSDSATIPSAVPEAPASAGPAATKPASPSAAPASASPSDTAIAAA